MNRMQVSCGQTVDETWVPGECCSHWTGCLGQFFNVFRIQKREYIVKGASVFKS